MMTCELCSPKCTHKSEREATCTLRSSVPTNGLVGRVYVTGGCFTDQNILICAVSLVSLHGVTTVYGRILFCALILSLP